MAEVKVSNNGTIFELTIQDNGTPTFLAGATVTIIILDRDRRIQKEAIITNEQAGICQISLTREDLATPGVYAMQAIVRFPYQGDSEYASDIESFTVGKRL